jgi:hypothetical protein
MEEQVMLQISSSTTGDGYQYVYLNLEEYEVEEDVALEDCKLIAECWAEMGLLE